MEEEEILRIARLEDPEEKVEEEEEPDQEGREEEIQVQVEEEEYLGQGLEAADFFCLSCVMRPCVCILVSLEGRMKILEGKNLKNEVGGRGVTIQTNQLGLNGDAFPKPQNENVHPIELCSKTEQLENESLKNSNKESEYWIREILQEIMNEIPDIPGKNQSESRDSKLKSAKLGSNRASSATTTPPPKPSSISSTSKVRAAIAKLNSKPSEPFKISTKSSRTSAAGPSIKKVELPHSFIKQPPPEPPAQSETGDNRLPTPPPIQPTRTINMVLKPPPSKVSKTPVRNKISLTKLSDPPTQPTTHPPPQASKMDPGLKQALTRQRMKSEGSPLRKKKEIKKNVGSSMKKKQKEDPEKLKLKKAAMRMSSSLTSWLKKTEGPKDDEASVAVSVKSMIKRHEESIILQEYKGQTNPTVNGEHHEHAGEQVHETGGYRRDAGGDMCTSPP